MAQQQLAIKAKRREAGRAPVTSKVSIKAAGAGDARRYYADGAAASPRRAAVARLRGDHLVLLKDVEVAERPGRPAGCRCSCWSAAAGGVVVVEGGKHVVGGEHDGERQVAARRCPLESSRKSGQMPACWQAKKLPLRPQPTAIFRRPPGAPGSGRTAGGRGAGIQGRTSPFRRRMHQGLDDQAAVLKGVFGGGPSRAAAAGRPRRRRSRRGGVAGVGLGTQTVWRAPSRGVGVMGRSLTSVTPGAPTVFAVVVAGGLTVWPFSGWPWLRQQWALILRAISVAEGAVGGVEGMAKAWAGEGREALGQPTTGFMGGWPATCPRVSSRA